MGVRCNGQKRKTPSHALPPLAHPEPEREKTPQPTNKQTNTGKRTQCLSCASEREIDYQRVIKFAAPSLAQGKRGQQLAKGCGMFVLTLVGSVNI